MTQEEKQLLFKDLCARLPYEVKIDEGYEEGQICPPILLTISYFYVNDNHRLETIRPYLRPLSSMTEEEKKELSHLLPKNWNVEIDKLNNFYFDMSPSIFIEIDVFLNIIDWLNKHHFDYKELIKKGLALEAPEGMYEIQN